MKTNVIICQRLKKIGRDLLFLINIRSQGKWIKNHLFQLIS